MVRFNGTKAIALFLYAVGISGALMAQATSNGGSPNVFGNNYHIGFERPEAWGLKYFASTSLLSGLQPPEPSEGHRVGSVSCGF